MWGLSSPRGIGGRHGEVWGAEADRHVDGEDLWGAHARLLAELPQQLSDVHISH